MEHPGEPGHQERGQSDVDQGGSENNTNGKDRERQERRQGNK